MTKKLSGKVALVTGGSRGIGAASARASRRSRRQCRDQLRRFPDKARSCGCGIEGQGALRPAPTRPTEASTEEVDQLVEECRQGFLDGSTSSGSRSSNIRAGFSEHLEAYTGGDSPSRP